MTLFVTHDPDEALPAQRVVVLAPVRDGGPVALSFFPSANPSPAISAKSCAPCNHDPPAITAEIWKRLKAPLRKYRGTMCRALGAACIGPRSIIG